MNCTVFFAAVSVVLLVKYWEFIFPLCFSYGLLVCLLYWAHGITCSSWISVPYCEGHEYDNY